MAGDWIKMRGNLWDDPRVTRLCDITDQPEAMIVGALYWLWATADQHTEDGVMPGLTLRSIDRKTGVPGFGAALVAIGWLADDPDGVVIQGFDQHNGSSAKKRCQTAKRVASFKAGNAPSVSDALAERDLEKRREEEELEKVKTHTVSLHPTDGGRVCGLMRQAGLSDGNPGHPDLLALIAAGASDAEFVGAAQAAIGKGKGFAYAIGTLKRQRIDAASSAAVMHAGPMPTGPPDRKATQLQVAALMTGTSRPPQPREIIDVTPRLITARSLG